MQPEPLTIPVTTIRDLPELCAALADDLARLQAEIDALPAEADPSERARLRRERRRLAVAFSVLMDYQTTITVTAPDDGTDTVETVPGCPLPALPDGLDLLAMHLRCR